MVPARSRTYSLRIWLSAVLMLRSGASTQLSVRISLSPCACSDACSGPVEFRDPGAHAPERPLLSWGDGNCEWQICVVELPLGNGLESVAASGPLFSHGFPTGRFCPTMAVLT